MITKKWGKRFLALANHVAQWSKDKSTKVGAVIVDSDKRIRSIGYNGFPANVNDNVEERHERPDKYLWTEHAERNAIYTASRTQTDLSDCVLFCNYFPCPDCARGIIQCGIRTVCFQHISTNGGKDSQDFNRTRQISKQMLIEAGISIKQIQIDN